MQRGLYFVHSFISLDNLPTDEFSPWRNLVMQNTVKIKAKIKATVRTITHTTFLDDTVKTNIKY